jgi:hypothetical protein
VCIHVFLYIYMYLGAKDKGYENFNSRSYKATAVFDRRKYYTNSKDFNTGIYTLTYVYLYTYMYVYNNIYAHKYVCLYLYMQI